MRKASTETSAREKTPPSWRTWGAQEWGRALFRRIFVAEQAESRPVSRLLVTPEELGRAAGDPWADPDEVRDAFLSAVRATPRVVRTALSRANLDERGEWPRAELPPFFVYLVLTCLVASAADKEIITQGNFRRRLRRLLRHPVFTTYPLLDLPLLWEAFARWLSRRSSLGDPYRELILPDPGWMKRIGYSVRLAFPNRRDQLRLVEVLGDKGFDAEPPIPAVLRLVGRRVERFSDSFRNAYERFRVAFVTGEGALDRFSFWSAVREAARTELGPTRAMSRTPNFRLIMEPDHDLQTELVLLSDKRAAVKNESVGFRRTDASLVDLRYVVTTTDGGQHDAQAAVRLLLSGELVRNLPVLRRTPLWFAVQEGVLLFRRDEAGVRRLELNRQDEGEHWALVRRELASHLESAFPDEDVPEAYDSRYEGWIEFGSFDGALLARMLREGPLADVRCLQPTATCTWIRFAGGVALDDGYLGVRSSLPEVRINGARTVSVTRISEPARVSERESPMILRESPDCPGSFRFDLERGSSLDGRFSIVALNSGGIFAERTETFRPSVAIAAYKSPRNPSRWLKESGGPDMMPASRASEPFTDGDQSDASRGAPRRCKALSQGPDLPLPVPRPVRGIVSCYRARYSRTFGSLCSGSFLSLPTSSPMRESGKARASRVRLLSACGRKGRHFLSPRQCRPFARSAS